MMINIIIITISGYFIVRRDIVLSLLLCSLARSCELTKI